MKCIEFGAETYRFDSELLSWVDIAYMLHALQQNGHLRKKKIRPVFILLLGEKSYALYTVCPSKWSWISRFLI